MRNRTSFRVALSGVLAALMVVVMLLGTLIPGTTYLCPALAGAFLVPVVWELGVRNGGLAFAVVSLLSLFLAPDKQAALFFVLLFGWYPLLRPSLQRMRQKAVRWVVKFLLFNLALAAIALVTVFVLGLPLFGAEEKNGTVLVLVGMLVLGNIAFQLYDLLLGRLGDWYVMRLRPKLFPKGSL